MSNNAAEVKQASVTTAGQSITFTSMMSEVVIRVRSVTSVVYVGYNAVPSNSVGNGRIGLEDLGVFTIQGQITSLGFKTDLGTAIVEVIAYKTLATGRTAFQA